MSGSFASSGFAISSLWDALGVPSTKLPIDVTTFAWYLLPPVVCYFIVAVLAITPQTRAVRVALWPVVALLALRAAVSVDMSLGKPERQSFNIDLVLSMFSIATRTLDWTLAKEPLVRHLRPANGTPSIVLDALDLASSLRGHGWNWSRGLYIPPQTRPANHIPFAFCASLSVVAHVWICGALHRAVVAFMSVGVGSTLEGSSIFDETLPFAVRYLRSSILSVFIALGIYAILQIGYDICAISAVLLLGQDPVQWPPVFQAPWCATSLSDFWGRRWHQCFRRTFLFLGGYPLSLVLGRAGIVLGAFLSSAVFHYMALVTLDNRTEIWRMLVGFGMMAPGILAERAFCQLTGRRVGGVIGWIWTMAWLVLWGSVIVEGFARAGMVDSSGFVGSMMPVRIPVEHLTIKFDRWLHTM